MRCSVRLAAKASAMGSARPLRRPAFDQNRDSASYDPRRTEVVKELHRDLVIALSEWCISGTCLIARSTPGIDYDLVVYQDACTVVGRD